jgi:hypothetical protein
VSLGRALPFVTCTGDLADAQRTAVPVVGLADYLARQELTNDA